VVAASSGPALEEESEDVDLAGDELAGGSDEASAAAEDQHSGGVGLH
jgi:hypothetical protein